MSAVKSKCGERFKRKPKPCKSCPLMANLSKKKQKRLIRKLKKKT